MTAVLSLGNARMVLLRNLMVQRHAWTVVAFGVIEPILYLLSIGTGVGRMIGPLNGIGVSVTYPMYIAPGLLAMAAMNGSINTTSFGVFDRLRYGTVYQTMLSTPVRPRGIAFGEMAWAVLRGTIEATGFLLVMAVAGLVRSPWALLAVPGAVLIGYAFACAGLLIATFMREFADAQLTQLVLLPMFLFATTFYPITVYPTPVRWLVRTLPLFHSIQLVREPVLGTVGPDLVWSVVYLLALGTVCLWWATRRIERRLYA